MKTLTLFIFSALLFLIPTAQAQLVCPMHAIEQITDESSGGSFDPKIDLNGTRIAFESDADINGPNTGGNFEVYVFDITTGIFTQITDEPSGDSENPSINIDGTRVAFESRANINGGNPTGLSDQIYLARCLDTAVGRPIPTLSEWGLIGLAAAMGVFGIFYAIRRRTAADA